jgi:hypothetical protein
MVAVNVAILIAAWVSDSLGDVRAWTLVAAVLDRLHHKPRTGQVGQQIRRRRTQPPRSLERDFKAVRGGCSGTAWFINP